ncbi:MAG: multicopper oxidase family protein [Candidatus Nanopelagicales bacterium]|jgi:FtsP/CotA-like multicopper oxidase with cupredoxin domain
MTVLLSRRQLLAGALGVGAVGVLAGCAAGSGTATDPEAMASAVVAAEKARATTGKTQRVTLTAVPLQVDLAGRVVTTWAYGDSVPGRPIRATAGDRVQVVVQNGLPEATSVHWHGLAIRNDMDGVPGLTTPEIAAGASFEYDFVVPDAGTHWFHPHHGAQVDRGLYAPFIVDAPDEPGRYDHEWILVLDDWSDGIGPSLMDTYNALVAAGKDGNGMDHMGMGGMNMDGGDVDYSLYVINGRPPADPDVLAAEPGQKVRLRIINAAADSIFDVALAGHQLQITHTDGYAVNPVPTSLLRLGMGERYDAVVTLSDGVFPFVARRYGKPGLARALVRTGAGAVPAAAFEPTELSGYPLTADVLSAAPGTALAKKDADTSQEVVLSGSMAPYVWTINGRTYDDTVPLTVAAGQTARLRVMNHSMMAHPLHLHGHTFQLGTAGGSGTRKDTVLVPPMGAVDLAVLADNPGQWMLHCHTAVHMEAGMMTRLDYTT